MNITSKKNQKYMLQHISFFSFDLKKKILIVEKSPIKMLFTSEKNSPPSSIKSKTFFTKKLRRTLFQKKPKKILSNVRQIVMYSSNHP
jgi:hypothetical protein